jgi:hypothetical protein
MIEEKGISPSNLEAIKKRVKFLEFKDPNDVIFELLKLQSSEEEKPRRNATKTIENIPIPNHNSPVISL